MTKEEFARLEQRIHDLETLLRGKSSNGTDGGVVHLLQRIVETLYGPKEKPGGIVEDVGKMKRIMWIGVGMMLSIEVIGKAIGFMRTL